MRRLIFLCIVIAVIFLVIGGGKPSEVHTLVGYMYIEGNVLHFDEIEIITKDDRDRIKDLNLTELNDLPNGYYFHNLEKKPVTYKLILDTEYIFTDNNLNFLKESDGNRTYKTMKKWEFLYGSSYQDISLVEQRIPYFIKVQDNKVISIVEEFIYTQ